MEKKYLENGWYILQQKTVFAANCLGTMKQNIKALPMGLIHGGN